VHSAVFVWSTAAVAAVEWAEDSRLYRPHGCLREAFSRVKAFAGCRAVKWLPPGTLRAEGIVGLRVACALAKPPAGEYRASNWDSFHFRQGPAVIELSILTGELPLSNARERELLAALYSRAKAHELQ
jgi:hypothetical protein